MQVRYQLRHRPVAPKGNYDRLLHPGGGLHVGRGGYSPAACGAGRSSGMTGQSFHSRSSE